MGKRKTLVVSIVAIVVVVLAFFIFVDLAETPTLFGYKGYSIFN